MVEQEIKKIEIETKDLVKMWTLRLLNDRGVDLLVSAMIRGNEKLIFCENDILNEDHDNVGSFSNY